MKILLVVLLLAVVVNGLLTEPPSNMPELVKFMCCKANSTTYYEVPLNDPTVLTKFDFTKRTHFFFHGWNSNISEYWSNNYKTNWLNSGRQENLCIVDWGALAYGDIVTVAVDTQRYVGNYTAQVYLAWLHTQGLSYSDIILIGHSMGGQISGYIGNSLSGLIKHIIGLDPAGPFFLGLPESMRLSANDATYVQCIHTSAPTYGYTGRCGDADFYINYGIILQPQCPIVTPADQVTVHCSHARALDIFIDSILYPTQYLCKGIRCSSLFSYIIRICNPASVTVFGLDANKALTGEFYTSTKNSKTCTGDLYIDYIPVTLFE